MSCVYRATFLGECMYLSTLKDVIATKMIKMQLTPSAAKWSRIWAQCFAALGVRLLRTTIGTKNNVRIIQLYTTPSQNFMTLNISVFPITFFDITKNLAFSQKWIIYALKLRGRAKKAQRAKKRISKSPKFGGRV